jgi:hypothetical protein
MKKYKVHFSLWNLFEETQSEIVNLQNRLKVLIVAASSGAWYASNADNAMYVAIAGFVIDNLLGCIFLEKKEQ